jgi:lactate permease
MTTWTQNYDPVGHWWLSALIAAVPILILFALLVGFSIRPHIAALSGGLAAIAVAVLFFHMPPVLASVSFLYGVAYGLLKIAWIVVAAVYLYDISVYTGQFEILKASVTSITPDRRIQLLLVAFCFGAFLEGAAGFGTPVAIAGALLIGLGFRPLQAAMLNLIANTAPVAFGAIGAPVHALAAVSGLPESDLSAMIGRILPFMSILVPIWLVRTMVSWKKTLEVMPAILVVGISFAGTQYYWSNYRDSNLVDIIAGIVSLLATTLFLRFWQPKHIYRFAEDDETAIHDAKQYSTGQVLRAWMPFAILSLVVLLWGLPTIKTALNNATTPAIHDGGWNVPYLHKAILRAQPVVVKPTPEAAKFDFNWLAATGSGCFIASVLAGLFLGESPKTLLQIFLRTLFKMRFAVMAIVCMLGLGFVTRYSGTDAVLGLAFTRTGWLYPFFGTFLGWLGVALTGSDTSSNTIFGGLQRITAQQIHIDPVLMCAANSAGGVMGKMVDAQSICIATAATHQVGNEGKILRLVFWHSVALAAMVGLIVMAYAYLFPHAVPHGLTFMK